jgi:hypothetical protein
MRLLKSLSTVASLCLALCSFTSQATLIFQDNFNSEHGGVGIVNYTGFANWTVSNGTVDLIGNGYFDFYPGHGLYVDLDGSTQLAGHLISTSLSLGAGTYVLSFDLGGSTRTGYDSGNTVDVAVELGVASQTYSLATTDPLLTRTIIFTLSSAQTIDLAFHNLGGDNVGAILDNVSLSSVPDGGMTVVLLGSALLGIAGVRRFTKTASPAAQ